MWWRKFHDQAGDQMPARIEWEALPLWFAGSAFLIWFCRQIKRVQVDERGLYVSNYWSEVNIPFGEISHLTERAWFVPRSVTVHLRRPSAFGDRIVFVPRLQWIPFGPHPVIEELLRLCNVARNREESRGGSAAPAEPAS
jgi:hypothetical protein